MIYQQNKRKSKTVNNEPTMTDQSMANDTDINVIVKSFKVTGMVPGAKNEGIYADFTEFPRGLREMMHLAKTLKSEMKRLPPQLQNIGPEQLLSLTPEQLKNILTPAQPEPKPEESK